MGVRLTPETGAEYVEFGCIPLYFKVSTEGAGELGVNNLGVIGQIVPAKKGGYPINAFSKELGLKFTQSAGVQAPISFKGAGEHDSLITQDSTIKGSFEGATKSQSGEQTLSYGTGEYLELRA